MWYLSFPLFFLSLHVPPPSPTNPHAGLNSSAASVANSGRCEGDLRIGDRVLVAGQRIGAIKFFGTTNFAPGNSPVQSLLNLNSLEYQRFKNLHVNKT